MISVLIPVYNYNCVALVESIHKQLTTASIEFEIKCLDDASELYTFENKQVSNLSNTSYEVSNINKGRIDTRQHLAKSATYNWLLFLDADVLPNSPDYILNYLNLINSQNDAIFGGIAYESQPPKSEHMLRWKYGHKNETSSANERNKKTYKAIVSANFLIKKSIFIKINSQINFRGYGYDNYFGYLLKAQKIKVTHVNNEVYHLGLEDSNTYLKKKEQAAETLIALYNAGNMPAHDNDLLKLFQILRNIRLHYFFHLFHKYFAPLMKKNLISEHPSIKLLQLYRISYMCHFYLKKA